MVVGIINMGSEDVLTWIAATHMAFFFPTTASKLLLDQPESCAIKEMWDYSDY